MKPTPTVVAAALDALKAMGLTQRAVAAELGVTPGLVTQWRNGWRPIPPEHFTALDRLILTAWQRAGRRKDWPRRARRVQLAYRAYEHALLSTMERLQPLEGIRTLYAQAERDWRVINDGMARRPESLSRDEVWRMAVAAKVLADTLELMVLLKPLEKHVEEGRDAEEVHPR